MRAQYRTTPALTPTLSRRERGQEELPSRYLRNDSIYRTSTGPHAVPVPGIGFMHKPGKAGSYRDRVVSNYVMVYVLRGEGTYVDWQDRSYSIEPGCVIQMPADRRHTVVHNPDGRWMECWFLLNGDFARALSRIGVIDESRLVLRCGVDLSIVERIDEMLHDLRHGPDSAIPALGPRAADILIQLHARDRQSRVPHPQESLVESACQRLSRNLDRRINVAELLGASDLSYERFRKLFREHTGVSPGEYRIRKRIDRARELLAEGKLSNKQIAYALGYRDPFTFSKQFKQVVGMAPAAFREMV